MYQIIIKSLCLLLIVSLVGCFGNPEPKACKYQTPVAVFAGIDSLSNHYFELNGQDAVERVAVPQLSMNIELYQSGCDFLQQEFRFLLQGKYPLNIPADECAMDIAMIFYNLSQIDPKLNLFQQWAEAIKTDAKTFKYNEKIPLQGSGITVQIDKMHQAETAMLSVIFSQ